MKCRKCGINIELDEYTDLYRIEEHHLHPSFMDNPKGLGILIPLCRDCHIEKLHPLILQIVVKHSNLLSHKNKSVFWIWKYHVLHNQKALCIDKVKEFTLNWLKKDDTHNTTGR